MKKAHSEEQLHSKEENKMEARDQRMFSRAVIWAGVAMLVIFVLALLLVRRSAAHIQPVTPNNHPTSRLVQAAPESLA